MTLVSSHSSHKLRRTKAFTLIELVVVLLVIGVLAALLLPAVQSSREAARRMQCQSNLKNIALAAMNFESAYGRFPPGYLGSAENAAHDTSERWIGHLVYLLPFLEQTAIYARFADARELNEKKIWSGSGLRPTDFQSWWLDDDLDPKDLDTCWDVAQSRLPVLLCPSDSPYANQVATTTILHSWTENLTLYIAGAGIPIAQSRFLGRTNYLGSAGRGGKTKLEHWNHWIGIFYNRSSTKVAEITDGTSNTLLFGEVTGRWNDASIPSGREWSFAWTAGSMPTFWGLKDPNGTDDFLYYRFTSLHPAGANFALADGSVDLLSREIDDRIFQSYGGMSDGETFER